MVSDINIYTLLHFVPDKNEYFSYHSTFDQNTFHVCHQSFLGKHKHVLIIVYINGNIFPFFINIITPVILHIEPDAFYGCKELKEESKFLL